MPWFVGMDEAGYGPNLGPLVQTAVSLYRESTDGDPWVDLALAIHRIGERPVGRILVDDSKKVHSGKRGFERLERGICSTLLSHDGTFADVIQPILVEPSLADLIAESWFVQSTRVPSAAGTVAADREAFARIAAESGIAFGPSKALVTPATRFNEIVGAAGNKAEILLRGLVVLLREVATLPGFGPILVSVDSLGGRTHYAGVLKHTFPQCRPLIEIEGPEFCRYRLEGLGRVVVVEFQPRSDAVHLTVALASMLAKYIRETCMGMFNDWWANRLPGLKPTAGYPLDARRFREAISAHVDAGGMAWRTIWRER